MDMTGVTLQVLPDYQLKLRFANGSEALINMSHRLRAIRFGRLSSPELFASARLADGEVVWSWRRDPGVHPFLPVRERQRGQERPFPGESTK